MKKVFKIVFVTTLAVATLFKISIKMNSASGLILYNIEALAADEGDEGCDIVLYNRDQMEDTRIEHVQCDIKGELYFIIDGKKNILNDATSAITSIKVYVCSDRPGYCCRKSWGEKGWEYL